MPIREQWRPSILVGACAMVALFSANAMGQVCSNPHNGNSGTACCQPVGPDVIVGDIHQTANYSSEVINGVRYDAFSFGTVSCNVGDQVLQWNPYPSNRHPAIAQNMYKFTMQENGVSRFEQIGMSWLKHGFAALTGNVCGCGCISPGTSSRLGVGCSDPYTATRNGTQGGLGPRWQVNPHTGFFPTNGPANPSYSGQTARRLRVRGDDLQTASNSIRYFVEAQYVSPDDAEHGNQDNNASWRRVNITQSGTNWTAAVMETTQREQPGIRAWKANDNGVQEVDLRVPGEGLFIAAAKAVDLGNGMWSYEYAVQNLNSDRAGYSFSVPLPDGATVTNIDFRSPEYHSGDAVNNMSNGSLNFDNSNWIVTHENDTLTWTCPQTFAQNANANALRWGTLYNFRFEANVAPESGIIKLGLFKPGSPDSVDGVIVVPGQLPGGGCDGDIMPPGGDGTVNVEDLLAVIANWGPCKGCAADIDGNGAVNVDDLLTVISAWGACQ